MLELLTAIRQLTTVAPSGHQHSRPGWVQIDCPYCAFPGAGKFHLGIAGIGRFRANCWKCGPHPPFEALSLASNKPLSVVRGVLTPLLADRAPQTRFEPLNAGLLELPNGLEGLNRAHIAYLRGRGLGPQQAKHYGLRGLGLPAGRLRGRIFIPITYEWEVVSWTTRSISPTSTRRYHSAAATQEKLPHKHLLYAEDDVVDALVILEGPVDVWKFGPGATATFGLTFSPQQVARAGMYPRRFICYDNGREAQVRANALARQLSAFAGDTDVITWGDASVGDVGDMSYEDINRLRRYLGFPSLPWKI